MPPQAWVGTFAEKKPISLMTASRGSTLPSTVAVITPQRPLALDHGSRMRNVRDRNIHGTSPCAHLAAVAGLLERAPNACRPRRLCPRRRLKSLAQTWCSEYR
jgi:hypothetical protein